MSPARRAAAWGALLALGLAAGCSGAASDAATDAAPQAAPTRHVFEEVHFGNVPVTLTLYASDEEEARGAAQAAFARIAELSAMMTDYALDPPSPLNRIAVAAPAPVPVPPELFTALARAVDMHAITGGAFDVTAKPYVQLWRVSRRLGELPPQDRLRRAARLVDIAAL